MPVMTPSQLGQMYGSSAPPAMGPPRPPMPPLMSNGLPSPPTAPMTAYQTGQSIGQNIVRPAVNAVNKVAKDVKRVGKAGLAVAPVVGAFNTVDRFSNQNSGAEDVIANAGFDANQPISPLQFAGATGASLLRDTGNAATFGLADWAGGKLGGKMADWFLPADPAGSGATQPAPQPRQAVPNQPTQPVQPSPSPQPDTARRRQAERGMTGNAGGLPSNAATPDTEPFSRLSAAANYPNDNTISNLGDRATATDLATQTQGAMLANQGYSPITDAGSGGIMRKVTPNAGFGANAPNRVAAPGQSAGTTTYQVPGVQGQATFQGLPAQQRGGYMVQDQGNGGTIEGNVARLNSQIAAIRSQREAQNPGITTGGVGGGLPSAPTMDVFARPGDGWGDSEMRAEQYRGMMNQAGTGRGMTRNQRAAMAAGAQGLIAPGLAQMQQQGQMYGQQLDAYGRQQTAQAALQQQDRAYGIDQRKADLDAQKWQQQYGLDAAKAEYQAKLQGAQTQEAQARAQGLARPQQLMQMYQDMYKKNPNDKEALDHIRGLILMSQRRNEPQGDELAQLLASKLPQAGQ